MCLKLNLNVSETIWQISNSQMIDVAMMSWVQEVNLND